MPTTLRVSILGTPFAIGCADTALAAELGRLLAAFPDAAQVPDRPSVAVPVAPGADAETVLAELNATALAGADCLAVHAGVVAAGGRAVAFPGPSGAGKTTLTAACLVAGLDYSSDEALCLDWDTGAVRPYPRPLALTPTAAALAGALPAPAGPGALPAPVDLAGLPAPVGGSAPAGGRVPAGTATTAEDSREILLTAADIGARVALEPLALAHVVLPRRTETAAGVTIGPAPRSAAVAELLRRSFTSHRRPEQAFALAHQVVGAAGTWWLDLGDPRAAAALLADLLRHDA